MLMDLAPIVLFVYNRPQHTFRTLEALSENELAKKSILFIYADGAKDNATEETLAQIEATRQILKKKQWCKEVHIIESRENKGLADSIKSGVSEILNKYGKAIILEDDIVVAPYFLDYMNQGLNLYKDENKVMHISSYLPPKGRNIKLPDTFLLSFMSCWGWATWKDRWDLFIDDIDLLYNKLKDVQDFNYTGLIETDMFAQIEANYNGTLKTWAIKWFSTIYLNKGLCLYPRYSLVDNIGLDGSGNNCGPRSTDYFHPNLYQNRIDVTKISPIVESKKGRKYLYYCYERIHRLDYPGSFKKTNNLVELIRNKSPKLTNNIFKLYNLITRKYK